MPLSFLKNIETRYIHAFEFANAMRYQYFQKNGGWPDVIFMPQEAWGYFQKGYFQEDLKIPCLSENFSQVLRIQAATVWRRKQEIFRYSKKLYKFVYQYKFLPTTQYAPFLFLPSRCVFIELQDFQLLDKKFIGFFATMNYNVLREESLINLLYVREDRKTLSSIFHFDEKEFFIEKPKKVYFEFEHDDHEYLSQIDSDILIPNLIRTLNLLFYPCLCENCKQLQDNIGKKCKVNLFDYTKVADKPTIYTIDNFTNLPFFDF